MITPPQPTDSIVDQQGAMQQRFRTWTQLVSLLDVLEGSGSPEGVVESESRRFYMDTAGTSGAILYIKRDADIGGDRSLGWVLV